VAALQRGANAALTREVPSLRTAVVGVAWQTSETALADNLVFAALLCDAGGKAAGDGDTVFFNQLQSADGSVSVAAGSDREQVEVDLADVPAAVDRIVFAVYVNLGAAPRRTLGQLRSLTLRVLNADGGVELVRSEDLAPPLREETAVVLGALYRHQGDWKIRITGDAYASITDLATDYGVPL
jgi:tellurium resistance protein TerD